MDAGGYAAKELELLPPLAAPQPGIHQKLTADEVWGFDYFDSRTVDVHISACGEAGGRQRAVEPQNRVGCRLQVRGGEPRMRAYATPARRRAAASCGERDGIHFRPAKNGKEMVPAERNASWGPASSEPKTVWGVGYKFEVVSGA